MKKKLTVFLTRHQVGVQLNIPTHAVYRSIADGLVHPDAATITGAPLFRASRLLNIRQQLTKAEVLA
jgi:hypothetical protein